MSVHRDVVAVVQCDWKGAEVRGHLRDKPLYESCWQTWEEPGCSKADAWWRARNWGGWRMKNGKHFCPEHAAVSGKEGTDHE